MAPKEHLEFETLGRFKGLVKRRVFNPLVNYLLPLPILRLILRKSKSALVQESLRAPGSWRSMMISYARQSGSGLIDKVVTDYGVFPMGLRNRKKLVIQKLKALIEERSGEKEVRILYLGCGTGVSALEAIRDSSHAGIEAHLVDRNAEALEAGRHLSHEHGLSDRVHYIHADVRELGALVPKPVHILKLVGIAEYLTSVELLDVIRTVEPLLADDAAILINSLENRHGMHRFLKRAFNLSLQYKSPQEIIQILRWCGWRNFEVAYEPLKIFSVLTARRLAASCERAVSAPLPA